MHSAHTTQPTAGVITTILGINLNKRDFNSGGRDRNHNHCVCVCVRFFSLSHIHTPAVAALALLGFFSRIYLLDIYDESAEFAVNLPFGNGLRHGHKQFACV